MDEVEIQGANELLIEADPPLIWAVLADPRRIPDYFPSVTSVQVPAGAREEVGAVRRCEVELEGRRGEVVERCVAAVPHERLTHVMDEDPFGFSRLFADFGFSFVLEPEGPRRTLVRIEGFYREKTIVGRLVNRLMMRRKLDRLRAGILRNLKVLVEEGRQPAADAFGAAKSA